MPLPASPPRASLPPETVTLPKHLLQSQISVLNTNFKLLKDRIASTNAANARLRLQLDKHQELYELFGHCATINLDDVVNSSNPEDEEEDDGYWNDGHQSGHQGGHSSLLTQADVRAITQTVYDHAASTIAAVTSKNNLLTLENERLRSDIFALTKASRLASLTPSKVIKSDVNEGVVGLQVCSDMLASARMSLAGDLVLLSSPGTAESPVKTHTIQELADASLEDSVGGVGEQGEEFKIDAQTAQIEREVTKSLLPHKSGPGPVQVRPRAKHAHTNEAQRASKARSQASSQARSLRSLRFTLASPPPPS